MVRQVIPSCELLERRLALMRELARSLELVQTSVVRSDVAAIDSHSARQRELCDALRQLESEALACQQRNPIAEARKLRARRLGTGEQLPEGAVSPEVRQRWEMLTGELVEVEVRVSQLNRVYGALLRRAQRTLEIFMRLANAPNTYSPPKVAPGPSRLQEASHV